MRALILVVFSMLVTACGGSSEPSSPAASADAPKRETVFDPLVGTLDRAKGVQQTVDEQAAEQRRKLEEAEK
jgi:hypothetical protein